MSSSQSIVVSDTAQLKAVMMQYAAKGFTTLHSDTSSVTLSKKKSFNWVLAIVCLFIPILGWIALIFMLLAAGRGSEVVEIRVA